MLGLVALTFGIYGQTAWHPFINLDDDALIYGNPHVRNGLTWENILWAFTATSGASFWHPLTWLSHMLDVELFGMNAGGHHLMSAGIHALNAIVLFLVLARMTGFTWRSAFVAALFAVHPLHVESVAWVAERKDVLGALFFLLSLWAYTRYAERPGGGRYGLVALCFALSLMSKPMGVTLPFVLLLLDYWPLGRIEGMSPGGEGATGKFTPTPLNRILWEKIPLLLMAAGSAAMTLRYGEGTPWIGSLDEYPLWVRAANSVASYTTYLWKTVWPVNLAVYYPHLGREIPTWKVAAGSLFLIGVTFFVLRFGKRRPYLPVGWFFYLGTLVPVIGLVQVGEQAMADRYTYLPLIGVFIITAYGATEIAGGSLLRRRVLAGSISVALVLLITSACRQVGYWSDDAVLFRHAVDCTDSNWFAMTNLGADLEEQGRREEAINLYRQALRIQPRYPLANFNMGVALSRTGRKAEAISYYFAAIRLQPGYAMAFNNIGAIFLEQGRPMDAIQYLLTATQLDAGCADAFANLGFAMEKLGRRDEAIRYYAQSLYLRPSDVRARKKLDSLLVQDNLTPSSIIKPIHK